MRLHWTESVNVACVTWVQLFPLRCRFQYTNNKETTKATSVQHGSYFTGHPADISTKMKP